MEIRLKDLSIKISIRRIKLAHGEKYSHNELEIKQIDQGEMYRVNNVEVLLKSIIDSNTLLLSIEGSSLSTPFSSRALSLSIDLSKHVDKILALTIYNIGCDYEKGFEYYDRIGLERTPEIEPPPENIKYPCEPSDEWLKVSCWTYPYHVYSVDKLYPYTVFTLMKLGNKYLVILCLSNGSVTSYLMPGLEVEVHTGRSIEAIEPSVSLALSYADNPYEAIKQLVSTLSRYTFIKPRWLKPRPTIINKLGWCSWNALQLLDLSMDNVLKIIKGIMDRGIPVKWVIIDDGWQVEESKELRREHIESGIISVRIIKTLTPRKDRFPKGFKELVNMLKELGVEEVGLWHTINIHWGGAYKKVFNELGSRGYIDPNIGTYIPSPDLSESLEFYRRFLRYIRDNGFSFIKTDNQWYIKYAYKDWITAKASRNIMVSHQLAAYEHRLWILNSMAMNPENYSNMLLSNVTRVSLDYIPFWRQAAKLHILWSIYNSVFFSYITYPDYDMWMSYDPSAKLYAVAAVLSGGPIYITDRNPAKTNTELLKRIILPDGEIVKVDEPALPTLDSLFIDPYNEPRLLKIASKIGEIIVLGIFNIYRDQIRIKDIIDLSLIQYPLSEGEYLYYRVFRKTYGVVSPGDKIDIELDNNDCEIILLCPLRNGKTVIGLQEYLLPPYPITYSYINNKYYVTSKVNGTLLYYNEYRLLKKPIQTNTPLEI